MSSMSFVSIAGVDLPVAEEIKVMGVVLDWCLTFHKHVSVVARSYNYYAEATSHICHLLTMELAQTLACSLRSCLVLTTIMLCCVVPQAAVSRSCSGYKTTQLTFPSWSGNWTGELLHCTSMLLPNRVLYQLGYLALLLLPPPKKEVMFLVRSVCLFVCLSVYLSVCPLDYSQTCEQILTKFFGGVGMAQGPSDTILVAIWITLRIRSPKSEIRILGIGGGLCSLSISSCYYLPSFDDT